VVAEDGNGRLPSYLGLRFPAADIPAQARRLYAANRMRLIADAEYVPVPVRAAPGRAAPLDLSSAVLRSVSPVHLEYMRNMGTPASMSVSVLRGDGRLWGLISCHNAAPRGVPVEVRTACDLLGQVLSSHLEVKEHNEEVEERARLAVQLLRGDHVRRGARRTLVAFREVRLWPRERAATPRRQRATDHERRRRQTEPHSPSLGGGMYDRPKRLSVQSTQASGASQGIPVVGPLPRHPERMRGISTARPAEIPRIRSG
jgi:hypothetical protein